MKPIDFQGQGQGHTLHIVAKPCIHDTEPFQLGPSKSVHILFMTSTTPINVQCQGSKVKVTCLTLLLNLVNKISPFYIANAYAISLLIGEPSYPNISPYCRRVGRITEL